MAGGWTRDGAVQDQIDDTVKDAVLRARALHAARAIAPRNATIAASRSPRSAARRCPACAPASPASPCATRRSPTRPSTAAAARIASCARRWLGQHGPTAPNTENPPAASLVSTIPISPQSIQPGLPSRKQILDFIASSDQPAGKREIARAFGLSGQDKIALKRLLKDMADEGLIDSSPGRAFHQAGGVPKVTVLRVSQVDDSGHVWAVPEQWHAETPPPRLRVHRARQAQRARHRRPHPGAHRGERARAARPSDEEARSARPSWCWAWSSSEGDALLAVAGRQEGTARAADHRPEGRRARRPGAVRGDAAARRGSSARVDAVLGDPFAPRSFSLIAIHKHGLRARIRAGSDRRGGAGREACRSATREDLTHLPIVAIDPEDARDHDDAIWAEPRRRRRAAGTRSSPSPTSASTSAPARSSTARRGRAATASISPTASCRCCPRNCRPTSAR